MRLSKSYFGVNIFLGIALGCGYMTSLRFLGPVGISELLVLAVLLYLAAKDPSVFFRFGVGVQAVIKSYLFLSFFVLMPVVTIFVFVFFDVDASTPLYMISFMMGLLLMFCVIDGIKKGRIKVDVVALYFALAFLSTNSFYFLFMSQSTGIRESSFSNNPNQLLFYLISLSLLLVMYRPKLFLVSLLPMVYIGFESGSDVFLLLIFLVPTVYCYFRFVYVSKFSIGLNLVSFAFFAVLIMTFVSFIFVDQILAVWAAADEGGSRTSLMWNGVLASISSPVFGWGSGSFSGFLQPYQGQEAHNTFLDFAMQFGFFVPVIIYGLMIGSIVVALKRRQFLIASFIFAFIVSGMFHFSGRHFIFWVEMAIFWTYLFPSSIAPVVEPFNVLKKRPVCVV